ncbi:cytochrome P450 [Nonomuraea sp. NPDC050404]|uniref:cytochrome P450 n=1 Tax=Nonomuraea sp. NPDC050404 TaxID=3155783 RepID=UPI0033D1B6FA
MLKMPLPVSPVGGPNEQLEEIRETAPVCPVRVPSGCEFYMLTRHDDIQAVLRDRRFSRKLTAPGSPSLVGNGVETVEGGIFNLDPPDHTRVRKVIAPFFTPGGVDRLVPMIQGHVNRQLDRIETGPPTFDLHTAYAAPLSLEVFCDVMGIRHEWRQAIGTAFQTGVELRRDHTSAQDATDRVIEVSRSLAASGDVAPDGPIAALTAAHAEGRISHDELVGTIVHLFVASLDPTVGTVTMGALSLLRHPGQLAEVLREPALWPRAVEEVLRFHHDAQVSFPRVALEDVEIHGVTIRRGEGVITSMLAGMWDPRRYPDPERFDFHRDEGDKHFADLSFGDGPHHCLGAWLARRYLTILLRSLFTRFPRLSPAVDWQDIPWDNSILFARPAELWVTR